MLRRHLAFGARNITELSQSVEGTLGATIFVAPRPEVTFQSFAGHYEAPSSSLWFCAYGAPIALGFPPTDDSYVRIQVGQRGTGATTLGRKLTTVTTDHGCISVGAARIDFPPDFEQLVWRVDRRHLIGRLRAVADATITRPLRFEAAFDLSRGLGASFRALLNSYATTVNENPPEVLRLVVPELEAALSGLLLAGSRHSYSNQFAREPVSVAPRQVFRVESHIEANWDKPIRVEELAAIAGTSTRSLFRTFQQVRGYSPLQFARKLRMERARKMLIEGKPALLVTEIALACGFGDLSRFSRDYAKAFGEPPSATWRRGRP